MKRARYFGYSRSLSFISIFALLGSLLLNIISPQLALAATSSGGFAKHEIPTSPQKDPDLDVARQRNLLSENSGPDVEGDSRVTANSPSTPSLNENIEQVPVISATKVDVLTVDNDGDSNADPGDSLRYTVVISNSGDMDGTGGNFTDTIDANTTLVAGSLRSSPIARNDAYNALGNVSLSVPAGSGLIAGLTPDNSDVDLDGGTVTVTISDTTSANGGEVAVAPDGSFTYNPPPGFEGLDTFSYSILDDEGLTDPALVTITVSDMIWFVDVGATCPCDGRLSNPFTDLAVTADSFDFNAADDPGDNIFVADGSYTGGLTLLANQLIVGDGSSSDLATVTGVTVPPYSTSLPTFSGTDPVITSAANGINLGSDNTVRGLTVGNTTGTGLAGVGVGTLTVSEATINGTGGGVDINGGTLAVTLDSLSANSSTEEGIRLVNVSGDFDVLAPGGSITTNNVPAVDIDGAPLDLGITMLSISANNATNGILVQNTTGSFTVTGSGSTDGSGGTISTITNRGASFINTANIALSNVTFNNASTTNGGSCTSLDNSGCNAAIHLQNTTSVTLTNVDASNSVQQGINGLNVTDFSLLNSTVTGCGDAVNEGCLRMVNLGGTAAIDNSDLSFPAERVAQIANTGVTLVLSVTNSTFRETQSSGFGADGLEITSNGASNTTIDIVNSSFLRNRTNGLQVFSEDTSFVSLDVTGSTFDRGMGIGIGMDLAADDTATLHFNVIANPLINSNGGQAINVFADGNATVQGRINDNPDIRAGGPTSSGLGIRAQANSNSTMILEIDNNTISDIGFDAGIQVNSRLDTDGTPSGRLDATINNNNITVDPFNSLYNIWVQAQDDNTTCANVTSNVNTPGFFAAFRVRTVNAGSTAILEGSGATATDVWNNNSNTPAGSVDSSHVGTLTLGGTCNTVSHPTLTLATSASLDTQPTSAERAPLPSSEATAPVTNGALPESGSLPPISELSFTSGYLLAPESGETINLGLGVINPFQVITITFDVTIDNPLSAGVTSVSNQGTISGSDFANVLTDDPDVGGAADPTTTPVVATPDMQIDKDDGGISAQAGDTILFTLSLTNTGDQNATGVVLTDTVPANTTFNLTASPAGWSCADGDPPGTTCTFDVSAAIGVEFPGNGGQATVTFAVDVDNPLAGGVTQIVNTAEVADDGTNGADPNPGDNSDTEITPITNDPPTLSNLAITTPVDENDVATLTGDISDPDATDTFTVTVDWGDGSPVSSFFYLSSTIAFTETHQYLDDNPTGTPSDSNSVDVTLFDSGGNNDTGNVSVTVNNLAPSLANVAATSPINESGFITLSGNISDTGTLDTFTMAVNWGDGSPVQFFPYPAGATTFSENHQYLDDDPTGTPSDSYTINLTLTDDDTGSDTDSATATVNNVAPSLVNVSVTSPVNENGSAMLSGNISDPGVLDSFTLTVDWGDGSLLENFNYTAGSTVFSESHQYLDDDPTGTPSDSYTINLTLTDDDTGSDTDSTTVTVNNVAPSLSNVTASSPVDENGTSSLTGTFSDPGLLDTFTLTVDWGDGTPPENFPYPAGSTAFLQTHQYLDDDPSGTPSDSYTINLTLTDDDTGSDTDSATVTVNNLAPSLANVTATSPVDENGISTLSGNISDIGTLDTFTLTVDWGDGSPLENFPYPAGSTAILETHQYLDDDPSGTPSDIYTVSLTLADDDTGSDTDSASVTVNNIAPSLANVTATSPVDENGLATLNGDIIDPGTLDTFTLTVDWGDGTPPENFNLPAGTTVVSETHQYLDDDPTGTPSDSYTINLTLTDDDTGGDSDSTTVVVNNVPPTLSNLVAATIDENGFSSLTGDINDPGTLDTFNLTVDWGDGTPPENFAYPAGTTTFNESHQYLDDNPTGTPSDIYTILLILQDDDTGSGIDSTTVTVNNVAPNFANLAVTPLIIDETDTITLTGTIVDPGTLDTFELIIDWADGITETLTYPAATTAFTQSHQYQDDALLAELLLADFTINLTLSDDDTGSITDTIVVTVNNVPPSLTNVNVTDVNEDESTSLTGSILEISPVDSFTLDVDWGDGLSDVFTYAVGTTAFTETHQYLDDDPSGTPSDIYSVTLTLVDDNGGSDTFTTPLTVSNIAPLVNAGSDQNLTFGMPVSFTGTFTDPGTLDTHTILWDFGDGMTTTGVLTPTHAYTNPGTFTASLTVTDDDMGVGVNTSEVMIIPVADLALAKGASPDPALAGTSLVYSLTLTNLGPLTATNMVLTDTLPAGVMFVDSSPICAEVGGLVTCNLGSLPIGDTLTVQISTTVGLTTQGAITNTAGVTAAELDLDTANNTASVTTMVEAQFCVYTHDFETPVGSEWSLQTISTTPSGRNFLGEFSNQTATLTLTALPDHNRVIVTTDLYLIRSWDGNQADPPLDYPTLVPTDHIGPDFWRMAIQGGPNLVNTTFANWNNFRQSYPSNYPFGDYPARTGALENNTLGYDFFGVPIDSVYRLPISTLHSGPDLILDFSAMGLQDIGDESWGLDNIQVCLDAGGVLPNVIYLPLITH
jgi:uncharacterized repeat protein (TIGR01451 family)